MKTFNMPALSAREMAELFGLSIQVVRQDGTTSDKVVGFDGAYAERQEKLAKLAEDKAQHAKLVEGERVARLERMAKLVETIPALFEESDETSDERIGLVGLLETPKYSPIIDVSKLGERIRRLNVGEAKTSRTLGNRRTKE